MCIRDSDQAAAQLAAQAGQMYLDGVAGHVAVTAQHQAFEIGARHDTASKQQQGLQQRPFARRQFHRDAEVPGTVLSLIHIYLGAGRSGRGKRLCPV